MVRVVSMLPSSLLLGPEIQAVNIEVVLHRHTGTVTWEYVISESFLMVLLYNCDILGKTLFFRNSTKNAPSLEGLRQRSIPLTLI
jgi:hypothetical protein